MIKVPQISTDAQPWTLLYRPKLGVLSELKKDTSLRSIPVVIVSSAGSAEDVNRAYDLAANCYIRKPMDLDTALDSIRDICAFWFQRVTLPIA